MTQQLCASRCLLMVDVGCLATVYLNRLGKEGCSTLSYEVTVDHCKRIIACREGHKGTRNDETIECYDGLITDIREGVT